MQLCSSKKPLYYLLGKHISKIIIIQIALSSTLKHFVKRLSYIIFKKYKQTFTKYRHKDHKLKIEPEDRLNRNQGNSDIVLLLAVKKIEIYSDLPLHKHVGLGKKKYSNYQKW